MGPARDSKETCESAECAIDLEFSIDSFSTTLTEMKKKKKRKKRKEKTNPERSRRGSWRGVGTAIVWREKEGWQRGEGAEEEGGRKVERSCSEINYAKYFPSLEYEIAPLEFLVTRGKRIYFATANPGDRVKNTFDGVAPPFETCREIELLTSTL